MVRYLVGLGHDRIGFLSGPLTVSTSRYRRDGFVSGMAAAGLSADLIEEGDFTYAGGQAAAAALLKGEPTAIFAANDQMALGVLATCRAAGVSMPRHQLGVEAMQAVVDALALEKPRVSSRAVCHFTWSFASLRHRRAEIRDPRPALGPLAESLEHTRMVHVGIRNTLFLTVRFGVLPRAADSGDQSRLVACYTTVSTCPRVGDEARANNGDVDLSARHSNSV